MKLVRAIKVLILALAVALTPAARGMAASAQETTTHSHDHSRMAGHRHDTAAHQHDTVAHHHDAGKQHDQALAASHDETMGCCTGDAPASTSKGDCGGMSGCALCCFTIFPVAGNLSHPLEHATALSWQMSQAIPPVASSPPFRPPRS